MEQAGPEPSAEPSTKLEAKPTIARNERVHERYAWVILTADVALGILSALTTTLPPLSWFSDPLYSTTYSVMGAWGISWVGFEILALVVILIPFRRGERWAWWTLWLLPGLWLCLFVLDTSLLGLLVLTLISVTGLLLSFRRFFPRPGDESPRVR
jgi:hypothetical protein